MRLGLGGLAQMRGGLVRLGLGGLARRRSGAVVVGGGTQLPLLLAPM